MAKIYFQFPSWRGRVYEVTGETYESFRRENGLVQLPEDRLMLKVELEPGYFPIASEAPTTGKVTVFKKARFVFDTNDSVRKFDGNWQPLVELLNAAGAMNTLFTVILTEEEYKRLKEGGLDNLKRRLSKRAASLLKLCSAEESWHDESGMPTLELLRTGRCP